MSGIDSRNPSCSTLPQRDESGIDSLQGALYGITLFLDLNAQPYERIVHFFRGSRDSLLFYICSCLCSQKFRFVQIPNSYWTLKPCGSIIRSSFTCINDYTHTPISLKIIKVLKDNIKRKRFVPIIVRESIKFPGITPFII
jgi:hypothetical protein